MTDKAQQAKAATRCGQIAWHYTCGVHAESIRREGRIRLEVGHTAKGERPAAWFTTSPAFEPTALSAIQMPDGSVHQISSPSEQARLTGGLFRFGVAASRLHRCSAWSEMSGCPALMQRAMENIAIRSGSDPWRDWRVSFKAVKAAAWIAVEQSADGLTWEPMALAQGFAAKAFHPPLTLTA